MLLSYESFAGNDLKFLNHSSCDNWNFQIQEAQSNLFSIPALYLDRIA